MAIAANLDQGLGQITQSQQGILGLTLLEITQQAIEDHDDQNGDRVFGKGLLSEIDASGNRGNHQQHDQHDVAELVPENLQGAAACLQLQPVRACIRQPAGNLGR